MREELKYMEIVYVFMNVYEIKIKNQLVSNSQ